MRTFAMLLCLFLVGYGTIAVVFLSNLAGIPLLLIGSLAFIIIAKDTEKVKGYDRRHWMNR